MIDFGPLASAQRGKIDLSGDTGWFHADAQEPNIQLFPTSLAFPTTAVGGDADLTFDIRHTGAADLHVDSLEFVGLDKAVYSLAPSVTPAQAGVQESRSAGLRFPLPSPQRRCASGRR